MDVHQLAQEQIDLAHQDPHGRSAQIVVHDGPLRQTVIALRTGTRPVAQAGSASAPATTVLRSIIAL